MCYIDSIKSYGKKGKLCHLIADTNEELHQMALLLDLKRHYFKPIGTPHYELYQKTRVKATALNCIPLSDAEFYKKVLDWRHKATTVIRSCNTKKEEKEVRKFLYR